MTTVAEAPSGNVTFVFTDIEGSTRLFHRFGDGYVGLLERHNRLLRAVWASHRGYEVSTEGDSFFVAFGRAGDALGACAAAQRGLTAETWPEGVQVKVRMGVHTGLASPRKGGYVALAVHQAARVMAAAHGGQVVVSQDTVDALDTPLGDVGLELLGRFQLRSFDEPLTLYQVRAAGLPASFPAVRALPAGHHNIVRPAEPTVGREDLVAAVAGRVQPGRLVTLLGPGGVGKTTVAAELGIDLAPSWIDGVWMVDLSGVQDEALVGAAVAGAVGAGASPDRERWEDVLEHLAGRSAVVILDNCEQVIDACARIVVSLQARCPDVAVVATSRIPLEVPGEILWQVGPLEVPDESHQDAGDVLASPAGQLFQARGAAARPGFEVDRSNAADVAEIIRRLDGLPLSLELAAARLSAQSPAEIRAGLDDRFSLLRARTGTHPSRHSSIEDLLDWSYRSLGPDEQAAFRRLALFSTGFSMKGATGAVAGGGIEESDVALLVLSLVDRSLVVADLTANATRYRLMETFRAFGRKLLEERGETPRVAARLAGSFMESLGPWMQADPVWLAEVDTEADNLRGLVALLPDEEQETGQEIGCTLGRYHDGAQTYRDGIDELGRLARALTRPTPSRVSLLVTLADLHLRTGEVETARSLVSEAAALGEEVGAPPWDDVGIDRTLGEVARRSGNLDEAIGIARDALNRPLSDQGRSRMFNLLGTTSAALGDMDAAYEACRAELELNEKLGHTGYVASAHGNLAEIAMRRGDVSGAASHQEAGLAVALTEGATALVALALIMAARIAGHLNDWQAAALLHARGEALREELGLQLYEDDRRQSDELVTGARRELGDDRYGRLVEEGRELEIPDAADRAGAVFAAASRGSGA